MKELSEIYQQMLSVYHQKTGFAMEDSADLAVRLYAAAAEIQALYVYARWALTQSFPQSATGSYLDYHAQLRNITRKNGLRAQGILRFRVEEALEEDLPIPAGTVCTTAGLVRFVTKTAGTIPAGQPYADVAAEAESAGTAGNAAAGSVTLMPIAPTGVSGVTNPAAFTGGRSSETDEELRERVMNSYAGLSNGANAAFYEERALAHEGVAKAAVLPRWQGIGTVGVVVATTDGEPDEELLEEIRDDLDSVREIAVDVTVMAPTEQTVNVTVELLPQDGIPFAAASAAVQTAIQSFFNGNLLGKDVYRAALGDAIYRTGKVRSYEILAPAEDILTDGPTLPRLGTLTIREVSRWPM